jgi:hypothetical protein
MTRHGLSNDVEQIRFARGRIAPFAFLSPPELDPRETGMTVLKTLPSEMLGFAVLVSGTLAKLSVPDIEDFWLALATAIALFLIMHMRSRLSFAANTEAKP